MFTQEATEIFDLIGLKEESRSGKRLEVLRKELKQAVKPSLLEEPRVKEDPCGVAREMAEEIPRLQTEMLMAQLTDNREVFEALDEQVNGLRMLSLYIIFNQPCFQNSKA